MANYEDEDVIYIDIHIPSGLWPNANGRAGGAHRSVETGDQFDALPRNCGSTGIEDETINI